MGMLIHFYAGDPAKIGAAFTNNDFEALRDPSIILASAEFSLHINPEDLEMLSEEASQIAGLKEPLGYYDSLEQNVGGDSEGSSADAMTEKWIQLFASFSDDQAPQIGSAWMKAASNEYGKDFEVTDEVIQAISELIVVCRTALSHNTAVVNTWSL